MLRPDLLALSPDDLAALANRGLVKRAQRECETGELTAQWDTQEDGTIRALWSDSVTCTLPGGGTLRQALCSCGAADLCRHILRTVLAWQQHQSARPVPGGTPDTAPPGVVPPGPWDPGRLDDAAVARQVDRTVISRANRLWSQGVLAELLRSAKPSASFHHPGHTVRFPVPDDLRYAHCSCSEAPPCVHAVLAVRAFRLLDSNASSGIVSAGPLDSPVPPDVLRAAEGCVRDLLGDGLASLTTVWRDRVRRVAADCTAAALMWPAQILEELAEDFERYTARDGAFSPEQTVARAGELLLRLDAIRSGCAPLPQAFIRGLKGDRDCDLGTARMIGLGALVAETRRSTRVTTYLQSADTGHVMTVTQEHTENPDAAAGRRPFRELARGAGIKGTSLATLAGGQLVTHGGRRTASGRLSLGRARFAVNPQGYAWEQLKAPVLVEDFGELAARLRLLPPSSFRPRREGADFHVCPLSEVGEACFDPAGNRIVAALRDAAGGTALLVHPWTSRGERGAEALLATLRSQVQPLFVAGVVRATGGGLVIHPAALVLAGENGARRMLMPWLDADAAAPATTSPGAPRFEAAAGHLTRYGAAGELAAELLLNGLRRISTREWPGWDRGITETEERGYHRMSACLRQVKGGDGPDAALGLLKTLALARDLA